MAARNLGSLTIDLIAKTGGFERGFDRAARTADDRMRRIERRAKIAGAAIGVAISAGIAIATRGISQAITRMDDLTKAADRVQMPVEQLTRLEHAGSLADVSLQDLQSSMGRLTRSMSAALDPASRQAGIFEALGISVQDAEGNLRSAEEVFNDFADAFSQNRDAPELMAAGLEIFGRSFQNLVPLIKDGSQSIRDAGDEAERLGRVFDEESGRKAEKFGDDLTRLRGAVDGVWTQIAIGLLPTLERTTERLQDVSRDGQLAANAVTLLDAAVRAGVGAIDLYNESVRRTSIFMQLAVEAGAGFREAATNMVAFWADGSVVGGIDRMTDAWKEAEGQFYQTEEAAKGVQVAIAGIDDAPTGLFARSELQLDLEDQVEEMRRRLSEFFSDPTGRGASGSGSNEARRRMQEMLREQQRLADAQRGWTDQLLDAQAALDGPVAEANRQHEKQMSDLTRAYDEGEVKLSDYIQMQEVYEEQLNRTLEAIEAQRTPAQRMLEDLQFEQDLLRMTNEEREVAIALRWLNAEATDAERDAIANSVRELRQSREAMSDLIEAQDAVRGAGADFLTDWTTGAKSFKDAMIDALDSIHQRLTQMIAEQLMDQLFGQRGQDGGGQYGNWLSNIFGAMFGGGKANGGWASANRVFEVNERGLEMATVGGRDYMLTGNQPVHVTPNHKLPGGGTQVTTINMTLQGRMDRRSEQRVAQEVAVKQRMATVRG